MDTFTTLEGFSSRAQLRVPAAWQTPIWCLCFRSCVLVQSSHGWRLQSANAACVWHGAPRRLRGVVPWAGPEQHSGLRDLPAGRKCESSIFNFECEGRESVHFCTLNPEEVHSCIHYICYCIMKCTIAYFILSLAVLRGTVTLHLMSCSTFCFQRRLGTVLSIFRERMPEVYIQKCATGPEPETPKCSQSSICGLSFYERMRLITDTTGNKVYYT